MRALLVPYLVVSISTSHAQEPSLSALLELSHHCRSASCVDSFAVQAGFVKVETKGDNWSSTKEYHYGQDASLSWKNSLSYSATDSGYVLMLTTFDKAYSARLLAEVSTLGYQGRTDWGDVDYFQYTYHARSHPDQQLTCFLYTYTGNQNGRPEPTWGFSFFVKRKH